MKTFLFCISLLISQVSFGAIAFDTEAQTAVSAPVSSITGTIVVGSGLTNSIGIAAIASGATTITGATWGGSAMTKITSIGTGPSNISIWYFLSPPSGSTSVVGTFNSASGGQIILMTFQGVKQSTPIDTSTTSITNPPSATLTTANANEWLLDAVQVTGTLTITATSGQTEFQQNGTVGNVTTVGAYRAVTTAGSYTDAYTSTATVSSMNMAAMIPAPPATKGGFFFMFSQFLEPIQWLEGMAFAGSTFQW